MNQLSALPFCSAARRWLCLTWALVGATSLAWAAASKSPVPAPAPVATNAPPPVLVVPKSIFVSDIAKAASDPFYPNSTRRRRHAPATESREPKTATISAANMPSLKGVINGPKKRRLALINNQVFAEGDTLPVAAGGATNLIRCLEIHQDSVVISIDNQRQTLFLPKL
jgi:hypothetical protein